MSEVVRLDEFTRPQGGRPSPNEVFFERREFDLVLRLYGRMVAAGDWRDYAISHDTEKCEFAVYHRAADSLLYRIVKTPKLARKQVAYSVLSAAGRVLRRGHELAAVLRFLEPKELRLV